MQRKVFWMTFAVVGLIADVALPILVGPRRHGPYWHGQLVDRLPQRVVLAIIRQSELAQVQIPAVDKVYQLMDPRPGKRINRTTAFPSPVSSNCR